MSVLDDFTSEELKAEIELRYKLPMAQIKTNFYYRIHDEFRQLYDVGFEDPQMGDRYMTITGKVVRISKLDGNNDRERLIAAGFNPGMVDAAIFRQDTAALREMIAKINK